MNGIDAGLFVLGLLLGLLAGWRWFGQPRSAVVPAPPATATVGEEVEPEPARTTTSRPDDGVPAARIETLEREVTRLRAALGEAQARRSGLERALGQAHEELGRRRNGVTYPPAGSAPAVQPSAGAIRPAARPASAGGGEDDDLTRIRGIGPKLAQRLNDLGITSLRQLAGLTPEQVARLDAMLDFPGRVVRERWIEQAKALLGGD